MANSFWFPHDVDAIGDEKFSPLLKKHGWAGYGIYWALVEKLHKNNNALSRDYDCLAFDMREKAEILKNIIEEYKLFRLKDEKFSSDRVANNLKKRKEKSRKAKISAEIRHKSSHANA